VRAGDLLRDGQSQPGPALCSPLVHAVETVEDVRQMLGGDTDARVGHGDAHAGGLRAASDSDAAALGVFHRVIQQVDEQADQGVAIAGQGQVAGDITGQRQPLRLGQRPQRIGDIAQQGGKVDTFTGADLLRLPARQPEQVLCQAAQPVGLVGQIRQRCFVIFG